MEAQPSIDDLNSLARKEWERLKSSLDLKCHEYVLKKEANQIELARPGKTLTFVFESAKRNEDETCVLEVTATKNKTQYLFRRSENKMTGHFFDRQLLADLPPHLVHRLPKMTIEQMVDDAFKYISR